MSVPPPRSVLILARVITAIVGLAGAEGVLWFGGYPDWWRMDPILASGGPAYPSVSLHQLDRRTPRDLRTGAAATTSLESPQNPVLRRLLYSGIRLVRCGDASLDRSKAPSGVPGFEFRRRFVWNLPILFGDEEAGPPAGLCVLSFQRVS